MRKDLDSIQFIQIDKLMISLRHVKMLKLVGTTPQVTVSEGDGDVTYMLHHSGAEVFEKLKSVCAN